MFAVCARLCSLYLTPPRSRSCEEGYPHLQATADDTVDDPVAPLALIFDAYFCIAVSKPKKFVLIQNESVSRCPIECPSNGNCFDPDPDFNLSLALITCF
jgi:hypothetical protein